jgi:hypothetical protein
MSIEAPLAPVPVIPNEQARPHTQEQEFQYSADENVRRLQLIQHMPLQNIQRGNNAPQVAEPQTSQEGMNVQDLEDLFNAPDAQDPMENDIQAQNVEVSATSGRHRAPEETGRHRADDSREGLHAYGEDNSSRFLARAANRIASIADRFGKNMSSRRTTSELAQDKIERGRASVRAIGNTVLDSALSTGANVGVKYLDTKEAGKRSIDGVRNFFKDKAAAAREHKANFIGRIKNGGEKIARATRVGKDVLRVSGLVTLGAGIVAAELASDYVKDKKDAVKGYVKREFAAAKENVADLHAANKEYDAAKADQKVDKAYDKATARHRAAEAARLNAESLRYQPK